MQEVFINKVVIEKVRHLENITIDLSNKKKHLIFTGQNGSGKTSVLMGIRDFLRQFFAERTSNVANLKEGLKQFIQQRDEITNKLNNTNNGDKKTLLGQKNNCEDNIKSYQKHLADFGGTEITFNHNDLAVSLYKGGDFIVVFFPANRKTQFRNPEGVTKFKLNSPFTIDGYTANNFVQHIVNLKADKSFAKDDGDIETANKIEKWFENFEKHLKKIFEDETLHLEFDKRNYNFKIIQKGREPFDFATLADGHSSILRIVMELMLRMEHKRSYEIEGVVLIDEIESHLHVTLQKQILPFLIDTFPGIQFIVTTHSPFVLNSVSNAVIFDLEKRITTEDLSSYDGPEESYKWLLTTQIK